jgi:hypothetical protein
MRYGTAIYGARARDTATLPRLQFARAMCGLTFEVTGLRRQVA